MTPHLQYTVQPIPSEGVQEVRVTVDGTVVSTGHTAQFAWPSTGSSSVDLHAVIDGVGVGYGSYSGIWAIFKLMDDAGRRGGEDTYSFSGLRQGHSQAQPVTNSKGEPVTVRLKITFAGGVDPRTFRLTCPAIAAQ
jgi:type VI protein secretion system component VasK